MEDKLIDILKKCGIIKTEKSEEVKMLSVVMQDGLSKYDMYDYHIYGADIYGFMIQDGEHIKLGCYKSQNDAMEVFKQMTAYDGQNKVYFMPTQEKLEEIRKETFEKTIDRMAFTIQISGGQNIDDKALRKICTGLYNAGYHN